jgi:hypothetical protein
VLHIGQWHCFSGSAETATCEDGIQAVDGLRIWRTLYYTFPPFTSTHSLPPCFTFLCHVEPLTEAASSTSARQYAPLSHLHAPTVGTDPSRMQYDIHC